MAVSYVKFCPRCQTTMSVDASACVKCGHQFRTHFDPPVSEKTIAMTAADTHSVSGQQRNGHQHIAPPLTEAPRPTRLRPRRLPIVFGIILAAAALYGGLHLFHGRDRVEPVNSQTRPAVFTSYDIVFKDDHQGQPIPLALHDPRDLLRWQMTASPSAPNSANSTDDPVRVHLYLAGQIAVIPPNTHARVLQEGDQWQRVEILDGPHQGLSGYVDRANVERVSDSSSSSH